MFNLSKQSGLAAQRHFGITNPGAIPIPTIYDGSMFIWQRSVKAAHQINHSDEVP
jgi:hypothetical protein